MTEGDAGLPVGKLPAELLGRLLATYATSDPTVIVGPGVGGDAAAIDLGGTTLVVKSDPITFAAESPARYLVDVNANDLACLGATPHWMMVTALLPPGTTEQEVESHFRELRDACLQQRISLVGGHTEVTFGLDRPILVGVLIGKAEDGRGNLLYGSGLCTASHEDDAPGRNSLGLQGRKPVRERARAPIASTRRPGSRTLAQSPSSFPDSRTYRPSSGTTPRWCRRAV